MSHKRIVVQAPTAEKMRMARDILDANPEFAELRDKTPGEIAAWWAALPAPRKSGISLVLLQLIIMLQAEVADLRRLLQERGLS